MNVLKKVCSVTLSFSLVFPTLVSAEDVYEVTGNSMYPTLKEGQYVKKVSDTYKIGDTVVAKEKATGEMIVKRVKGQKLIGDNRTSKIYDIKDTDVIGKVATTSSNGNINAIKVKASEGPLISKAYAGDSTAIFLNSDTSLSGFGKNILGLFKTNGNTSTMTKISGPTGYEKLKIALGNNRRDDNIFGFKADASGNGLYNIYNVTTAATHPLYESQVRDASYTFPFEIIQMRVEPDGRVRAKGSEGQNYNLGFGYGFTFNRGNTEGGYQYIVDVLGKAENVIASGIGFEHSDKTQTASFTTPTFTIPSETPNFNIRSYNMSTVDGWDNASLKIELLDAATDAVVATFNNPWNRNHQYYTSNGSKGYINMPGTYKLRVTSSKISYKIQIEIRSDFPYKVLKEDALGTIEGSWTLLTENHDIYVHRSGYGYVRKVNVPAGLRFKPDTMIGGNNKYHIMDENGRVWRWSIETDFTMVSFPQVDGKDFYETYEVVEAANAYTMNMYKVRNKVTGETYVYVDGKGDFGELGLEGVTSVSAPTILTRNGVPMSNIQSIAAGRYFTIIVQNTNDGQIIWTAGKNESGQLGGGINLTVSEPFIVPGLTDIKLIQGYRGENTEHRFSYNSLAMSDTKMFGFGKSFSYPQEITLGSMPYISEVKQTYAVMTFLSKDDRVPYIAGNTWRGRRAGTLNNFDKIPADANFRSVYNDGQTYFSNVKALQAANDGGSIIDKNGRIWSWGIHYNAGQGTHMRTDGAYQWTENARPALLDGNNPSSIGPDIFVQLGGYGSVTQALDSNNKLWYITDHLFPISSTAAINNVTIEKLYSGVDSGAIIDNLGRLWVFGASGYGKLGLGNSTTVSYNDPKLLNPSLYNNEKVIHVTMLLRHTLFVTESGTVYAMGDNSYGQLGNGTFTNSNVPVKVKNIKDAVMVGGGDFHSLVLDKQGRVWAFGYAGDGSLGNNFSLTRGNFSTAVGNDLPEMSVLNNIKDYYLSKNGNKTFTLYGNVKEKEGETTNIKTTILGLEKQTTVDDSEWELDIYDQVKPRDWNVTVNVDEVGSEQIFQSLIKVAAEDERGGIIEQSFSGRIIVDNEKPIAPSWGDTCVINKEIESCYESNYFQPGGTNGVNSKVRLYLKPIQKIGDNKAPVKVQIQYRIKQPYGYPPSWSDWIDIETSNPNGYYYDFFQGFAGETQVKVRSIDAAGNISDENSEYRYVIINNSGAEVDKITAATKTVEKNLVNDVTFSSKTPSGSTVKSYGIQRKLKEEVSWTNLTPTRIPYSETAETTYSDVTGNLLGNAEYEYAVSIENTIAIGKEKIVSVITNPYESPNFIRKVNSDGIVFTVKQDERNKGEILYRLVIIDNQTGEIYAVDKKSSNVKEEVIFNVKEGDAPFSILNNSMTIKLLTKGLNGQFITTTYDENFENAPSIVSDKKVPEVYISVEGNPERLISSGDNKVNLSFSATDDVTVNNKLYVQLSADGTNWYGVKPDGSWEKNLWSRYSPTYKNFVLGETPGVRVIYARVKDEAGNIGVGITKILIADLVQRDGNSVLIDSGRNTSSQDTMSSAIYVNNVFVELSIPKTGNLTEVQYSFDGVNWSPWESLADENKKYISLPAVEGEHSVVTRFKNAYGDVTTIKEDNDVLKYILDKTSPELTVETVNGTRITKQTGILFKVTALDNLSKNISLTLASSGLEMYVNGVKTNTTSLINNTEQEIFINGLQQGFNVISFDIKDSAGNMDTKTLRIFKK